MGDNLSMNGAGVAMGHRPRLVMLDALRGVLALMIVWYHLFEGYAFASGSAFAHFFHGHLAVDFFFMLSGFSAVYAYDRRWTKSSQRPLTLKGFFQHRLRRLHTMVLLGAVIGFATFLIQGGVQWDGSATPFGWTVVALLLTMFLIPAYPGAGYEVRGNGEMYPLNGPFWALLFIYIGTALYAVVLRKCSNRVLRLLLLLFGAVWLWFVATDVSGYDMIGVGWMLDGANFFGGFLRMTVPFIIGMLVARRFRPLKVRGAFVVSIVLLYALFSMPPIAKTGAISLNGLYEVAVVVLLFPIVLRLVASEVVSHKSINRVSTLLGKISYPLFMVHYPVMYLFYAWLIKHEVYTFQETWEVAVLVVVVNLVLAYAALKLYDEPLQRWLKKRHEKGIS